MPERILIVEDEEKIARFVELELMHEGYLVDKAVNGREGLSAAQNGGYDLMLLDIMLPELSGFEVLRRLRKTSAIEELLARIRLVLKKSGRHAASTSQEGSQASQVVTFGELCLDERRHEVYYGDQVIELTNREFDLLKILLENKNTVMTRDILLSQVCGYDYMGETNVIDVYVRYLRSKIDERFGIKMIQTVRGVGYVIREGR